MLRDPQSEALFLGHLVSSRTILWGKKAEERRKILFLQIQDSFIDFFMLQRNVWTPVHEFSVSKVWEECESELKSRLELSKICFLHLLLSK